MIEVFKDISGYEGSYQISNTGKVKRLPHSFLHRGGATINKQEKILKGTLNEWGYPGVNLYINNKVAKMFSVHFLVASHFLPNPHNFPVINHIDGVKTNNNFENLEWCTQQHNVNHSYGMGLQTGRKGKDSNWYGKTGLSHHGAKRLQCLCTGRIVCLTDAAKELDISRTQMSRMVYGTRKNWTNFILA